MPRTRTQPPSPHDPLAAYPPMMTVSDVMLFCNICRNTAIKLMDENGGVVIRKGVKNTTRRISKERLREFLNLPDPKVRHGNFDGRFAESTHTQRSW